MRELVTAEILYKRPDHLWLLQTYVWQDWDLLPTFPRLKKFLSFWERELDGPLYRVTISSAEGLTDFRIAETLMRI